MDKKVFKKLTKQQFINYGFEYYNKKFYLNLKNIVIQALYRLYPFDKGLTIDYSIIIKQLTKFPTDNLQEIERAFEDFSEIPVQMPALEHIQVKTKNVKLSIFNPEEIDENIWNEELPKSLHEKFDPFKTNDLAQMKFLSFSKDRNNHIVVNDKVKAYLMNQK